MTTLAWAALATTAWLAALAAMTAALCAHYRRRDPVDDAIAEAEQLCSPTPIADEIEAWLEVRALLLADQIDPREDL